MATGNKKSKAESLELKERFKNPGRVVEEVPLDKYVKNNFLPYAFSVVLSRALVDVTGLKPVHKRILYTMYENGVTDRSDRQKVVRISGNVLLYHEHGDTSVEDALTALAVPDINRIPLIDGKGAFGGASRKYDPAASGRYIEARLTTPAILLLEELAEDAVDYEPNYDNTSKIAVRLPAKWPVALINGSSGIAVGYACSIPSHNPGEVMQALIKLVRKPDLTVDELMKIMPGPDFNMGGLILSNDGIKKYYETGRGSFKIRGRYNLIPQSRGRMVIDFYEIPYGTAVEKIMTEIRNGQERKGLFKEVSEYKNLSDLKHPTRLAITVKAGANVQMLVNELFKNTSLETTFAANLTTIIDNRPAQTGIIQLLQNFIDFRKECTRRKLVNRVEKKKKRSHMLEGILKVLVDIDEAIRIIRRSADAKQAKERLIKKFKIDDEQAEYILSLTLRRLTKQDANALQSEKKTLLADIGEIDKILGDKKLFDDFIIKEFKETAKILAKFKVQQNVYTTERKTIIQDKTELEVKQEQQEAAEAVETGVTDCYITLFANGKMVRTEERFYYPGRVAKYSPVIGHVKTRSDSEILLVESNGLAHKIPVNFYRNGIVVNAKSVGVKLSGKLIGLCPAETPDSEALFAMGSRSGLAKILRLSTIPLTKKVFTVFNLAKGDEIVNGSLLTDKDEFFVSITANNNILVYPTSGVRPTGANSGGVKSQTLKGDNDRVVFFGVAGEQVVSKTDKTIKVTPLIEIPTRGRGGMGVALHSMRKGETIIQTAYAGDNLMATTGKGKTVKLPAPSRRATSGEILDEETVIFGVKG